MKVTVRIYCRSIIKFAPRFSLHISEAQISRSVCFAGLIFSSLFLSEHFVNQTLLKHDLHFKFNMRLIRYWKPEGPINTLLFLLLSSGWKQTLSFSSKWIVFIRLYNYYTYIVYLSYFHFECYINSTILNLTMHKQNVTIYYYIIYIG